MLSSVGRAFTFTFLSGVTTVAQFETAINASEFLHVLTSDGVGVLGASALVSAAAFTGGVSGGGLAGARE